MLDLIFRRFHPKKTVPVPSNNENSKVEIIFVCYCGIVSKKSLSLFSSLLVKGLFVLDPMTEK
jgi:hypothetical protein